MRIAECAVDIDAPIDLVWAVMLDHRRYPEWNPFIFRVDCAADTFAPGVDLRLHVRWGHGGTTRSREIVARCEAPGSVNGGARSAVLTYEFRGWIHSLNLVRGTRLQILEQAPGGPTVYRTTETFTGWLAGKVPLPDVQDGFERHARALRTRVKALGG